MRSVFRLKTVNMKNSISKILLALMVLLFAGCGEWVDPKDLINGDVAPNSGIYKVGDYYNKNGKKGVVFWVDETGQHGKILSLKESVSALAWALDNSLIGANDWSDGANNMAVVKRIADWQSKYPAFEWCADLGEGWYLPAIEELKLFAIDQSVRDAVNITLTKRGTKLAHSGSSYWSSTEYESKVYDFFCARYVDMLYGSGYNFKYSDYYVRAVARF